MQLTHSCIITEDVKRLSEFYGMILQIEGNHYGDDYSEFQVGQNKLAIFSLTSHESLTPGSAKAASNMSIILEFCVQDVDSEYKRLKDMDIQWIKSPTVKPWGCKSFYFRDPDGNMISFYTQLSNE